MITLRDPSFLHSARENNYLINPAHPDFDSLQVRTPAPFVFDERLLGS